MICSRRFLSLSERLGDVSGGVVDWASFPYFRPQGRAFHYIEDFIEIICLQNLGCLITSRTWVGLTSIWGVPLAGGPLL